MCHAAAKVYLINVYDDILHSTTHIHSIDVFNSAMETDIQSF